MFELIHKLHEHLNQLKRFESGYTSANNKSMLVKFDEKIYRVDIKEVGEGEIIDHMDTLNN